LDLSLKPKDPSFGILRTIAPFQVYGDLRVARSSFIQQVSDSQPDASGINSKQGNIYERRTR